MKTYDDMIAGLPNNQFARPTGTFRDVDTFQFQQYVIYEVVTYTDDDNEVVEYENDLYFDECID